MPTATFGRLRELLTSNSSSSGQAASSGIISPRRNLPLNITLGANEMTRFVVADEQHDERAGEFATIVEAWAELKRRASVPFDQAPNQPPCTNWRDCRRMYEILEFDDAQTPWRELRRINALEISAQQTKWHAHPNGA